MRTYTCLKTGLFWALYEKHKYTVMEKCNFWTLKQVVYIETIVLNSHNRKNTNRKEH
jgi:hypothetical protein